MSTELTMAQRRRLWGMCTIGVLCVSAAAIVVLAFSADGRTSPTAGAYVPPSPWSYVALAVGGFSAVGALLLGFARAAIESSGT